MNAKAQNRRLSAVLMADIAGYTKLVEQDTDGTVAAWSAARAEVIDPEIANRAGRIVKYTGDGFLAEFPNVQDAVECAIAMQAGLVDNPLDFRMGVNLGDIVDDGTDIHGEGVNIAARIEALAAPGRISVSGMVYESVRNRIEAAFEDFGEHEVKHVSAPVRVYRIGARSAAPAAPVSADQVQSERPSIAVLPFQNMSGDPEQEFFADGMTEDIVTALSRFRSLSVVSRNSTISLKGSAEDVRDTAKTLGVRYIVEGSVRQGGNRIRISAQLVDADSGSHLWAERYDRTLDDIFAVQDEVTYAIVTEIAPEIDKQERDRAQTRPPENLDAWSLYQRGLSDYHETTAEGLERAIEKFDQVITLDPRFAAGFAMAADSRTRLCIHFSRGDESLLIKAAELSRTAIALDDRDPNCHLANARANMLLNRHDISLPRAKEAIALNPSSAMAYHASAMVHARAGLIQESFELSKRAVEIGARDLFFPGYIGYGARTLLDLGRYEEALEWSRRATEAINPRPVNFALNVAILTLLKRSDEVEKAKADLLKRWPDFTIAAYREHTFANIPNRDEGNAEVLAALRESGLPE